MGVLQCRPEVPVRCLGAEGHALIRPRTAMSAEELSDAPSSDAPSELSAANSEAPLDPIECDDHTMLENRTLLPLEKIVSEIPNTVILTNFRIIRTRQINPGWRLQLSGTTLPLLSSDVWLKDVFAVKVCRTSYPQSIMVACVLMVGLSVLGTDYAQVKITDEATVGLSIAQFGVYVIALVLGVFGQCIRLPALSVRAFGFEDPNGMTKIPMLPIHADMIQTFAESVRKVQFQMGVHKCPHIPHDRILGQTMIDKVQATRWYKARAARKEQGTELNRAHRRLG